MGQVTDLAGCHWQALRRTSVGSEGIRLELWRVICKIDKHTWLQQHVVLHAMEPRRPHFCCCLQGFARLNNPWQSFRGQQVC
jgi:hypothetical protein